MNATVKEVSLKRNSVQAVKDGKANEQVTQCRRPPATPSNMASASKAPRRDPEIVRLMEEIASSRASTRELTRQLEAKVHELRTAAAADIAAKTKSKSE